MSDEVNQQHMQAMGLDPEMLGTAVEVSKVSQEGRCPSTCEGAHCARENAHEGRHARGSFRWEDADADAPVPTKQREGDQPLPTGDGECVQDRVIAAMEESKRVGLERYGSTLRTFNGRRGIQDVIEEVRDLFVYLTQIEMESEADREKLVEVVAGVIDTKVGSLFQGDTRAQFCTELAETAVDAIMGYVSGQLVGDPASP